MTTWDVARACRGAQGLSHRLRNAIRFPNEALPSASFESASGPASHGGGGASSFSPTRGVCLGNLVAEPHEVHVQSVDDDKTPMLYLKIRRVEQRKNCDGKRLL